MGIEYEANFTSDISDHNVNNIINDIKNNCNVIVFLHEYNNTYHFKFSDSPIRETWPEDLTIEINLNKCYIVFHSGPLSKYEEILSCITNIINKYGYDIDFEEL